MKRRTHAITHWLLSCSLLLIVATQAQADRPAPERSYTVTSPSGTYTFEMVPLPNPMAATEAHGNAQQILADGSEKAIWGVRGWYAHQTFIADDGHGLVRMGPLAELPFNSRELAVAFYRDGKEIRRYTVGDLIDDEASVRYTVSHYIWQASDNRYPQILSDGRFQLRTVEDRVITFDIATGEMLAPGRPVASPGASPAVTREDADDLFLAMNLFRENDIAMEEARITRVIRNVSDGTLIWVTNQYADLPVFSSTTGYAFDANRKVARDSASGNLALRGGGPPAASFFPIDHRPDIEPHAAIEVWRTAMKNHALLGVEFQPRHDPTATLGFFVDITLHGPDCRLVWRVAHGRDPVPVAYVDAKKGDLLFFNSGVITGDAPSPKPAVVATDFSGTWVGKPCGDRRFIRTLILAPDGSLQVVDRNKVTSEGRWEIVRSDWIVLDRGASDGREKEPLPENLRFEPDSGMLHEMTPGASQPCRYSRSRAPVPAAGE